MSTILAPIDDVVAWLITHLFEAFSPIFGLTGGATWLLTILVLVVLMRLILVPLFIKQMHTQRAMTALTPRIAELRKKYKGDRERLNQETMKLYQEAGVNPLMGCLPVLLQMPIFFALFSVLRYIAEWKPKTPLLYGLSQKLIVSAQHAKIFGATIADKVLFTGTLHVPLHAKIVILFAVVISMTTTYLTVRQSMKRGMMPTGNDSPMGQSQKMMAYVMPLFALTGLYWQFGLVLYWVTTNVWTLGQQFVLLRKYPVGVPALGEGTGKAGGISKAGGIGRPATAMGLTGSAKPKPQPGSGTGRPPAGGGRPSAGGTGRPSAGGEGRPSAGSTGKPSAGGTGKPPTGGTGKPADAGKEASDAAVASGQNAGGVAGAGPSANGQAGSAGKAQADSVAGKAPSGQKSQGSGANLSKSSASGSAAGPSAEGSSNGHKPASGDGGGMLRRFGRGKAEPAKPEPAEPEVKIVRQQPQRQSRSKRSGKR